MRAPYALITRKSNTISAVDVVAPVPLVTTISKDPFEGVFDLMLKADPVVAPLMDSNT
jgi:predicted aconitase with swiveling domain